MNNQAAQTMPELPEPFQKAVIANRINTMAVRQGYEAGGYEKSPDLYTADQMRAMYQQGYAAALSQTAGVTEGWRSFPYSAAWCDGLIATLQECGEHTAAKQIAEIKKLTAAPAASGGEGTVDVDDDAGYLDAVADVLESIGKVVMARVVRVIAAHIRDLAPKPTPTEPLSSNPNPVSPSLSSESAASASERARELRERAEAHGGGVFVPIGDIRAIEQALTQQRVEASDTAYSLNMQKGEGQ